MKTRRIILMMLVVAILAGMAYVYQLYDDIHRDKLCNAGLRELYSAVLTDDGSVLTPEAYREKDATFPLGWNWCDRTRSPYVYRPFEGHVRFDWMRNEVGPPAPCRMILWCPRACHRGHRNVLLEDGRRIEMKDPEFAEASKNGFVVWR
jgi:hypothetical protein